MNSYTLFVDTDCDITPEIAKEYGAKLISMPYSIGDKEFHPYVSWDKFNSHEFYDLLRGGVLPTTAALSPVAYMEYFEPEFKAGRDILYIHFSTAMSATFNSMRLALEELQEKYPDRKCYTIDTKAMTLGSYVIDLELLQMYKDGKSIEELQKWAETEIYHYGFYFYADDLKFFHKSGRVSGFAAFFGGIVGIKPIIFIGDDGVMTTKAKARGRRGTLEKLLSYVIECEDDIKNHRVVIAHTDAEDLVEEFAGMLRAQFGEDLKIESHPVNPTAGSHCGPNCIGVCFHAKHR